MSDGQVRIQRLMERLADVFGIESSLVLTTTFLVIGEHHDKGGVPAETIADICGVRQATVSRNVKRLSKYKEGDEIKGYDLVYARQDYVERRRFLMFLTPKGESFLEELKDIIDS